MLVNKHSQPICPNGTLYVVTGCDKAATYALAISSASSLTCREELPKIRYRDGRWKGAEYALVDTTESDASFHAEKCAVIIRGMQIALNAAEWMNYVFRNVSPRRLSFYYLLDLPVTGPRAKRRTYLEKRFNLKNKLSNGDSIPVSSYHPYRIFKITHGNPRSHLIRLLRFYSSFSERFTSQQWFGPP